MRDVPFRFGLERVRELRAHDEGRAKEAFAASLQQRVRGAAQLAAADARLRDALIAGTPAEGLALSGSDLLARQSWVERLERSRGEAELALTHFDADLAASRASLTEASRRREALERLKERQAAAHRAQAARREAEVLDEIALRGHDRRPGA